MFKNIFKNKKKEVLSDKNHLVAALLIHAAKIDEHYTDLEKKIIKKALMNLNNISSDKAEELIKDAERKEEEQNQKQLWLKSLKRHLLRNTELKEKN